MKMVTVSFSEQEFEKLGIQNDSIDFKDLYELISIENSRRFFFIIPNFFHIISITFSLFYTYIGRRQKCPTTMIYSGN